MFSTSRRHRKRSGQSSIAVVLGLGPLLLYVMSYGPVLAYCIHAHEPGTDDFWKALNAVAIVYRPLAIVAPESFMRQYTSLCGLSDIEAFYFVQGLRRGCICRMDWEWDIHE